LEAEFGVRLPDLAAAEASSAADLATLIDRSPSGNSSIQESPSALRAAIETQKLYLAAPEKGVFAAETLNDVLRYRALHDASRVHLDITEDTESGEKNVTLTFAELYSAAQRCATELARLGVPPGGRVSLMLPTSRAFFVSYAGILLAGAISSPHLSSVSRGSHRRIRRPPVCHSK